MRVSMTDALEADRRGDHASLVSICLAAARDHDIPFLDTILTRLMARGEVMDGVVVTRILAQAAPIMVGRYWKCRCGTIHDRSKATVFRLVPCDNDGCTSGHGMPPFMSDVRRTYESALRLVLGDSKYLREALQILGDGEGDPWSLWRAHRVLSKRGFV